MFKIHKKTSKYFEQLQIPPTETEYCSLAFTRVASKGPSLLLRLHFKCPGYRRFELMVNQRKTCAGLSTQIQTRQFLAILVPFGEIFASTGPLGQVFVDN